MGEAWRFRRTFERARDLRKAQDAWCLKAQAAASTGQLSLLAGEEFPSSLELDVIVGKILLLVLSNLAGVLRGDVRGLSQHDY